MADSVITDAPGGITPVNDDTVERIRRNFSQKQLVLICHKSKVLEPDPEIFIVGTPFKNFPTAAKT